MKTLRFLPLLALTASAIAGVTSTDAYEDSSTTRQSHSGRCKETATPGACYYSNLFRNAVYVVNDTSDFVTFFVYFADRPGPNSISKMIRTNAHVYEMVVPPYQTRFFEQKASHYWVGTRTGKWAIDPSRGRIVSQ